MSYSIKHMSLSPITFQCLNCQREPNLLNNSGLTNMGSSIKMKNRQINLAHSDKYFSLTTFGKLDTFYSEEGGLVNMGVKER